MHTCPFCSPKTSLFENEHALVIKDHYPVNEGHLLVVPKRHISNYFQATKAEVLAIDEALCWGKAYLDQTHCPDGYNIGSNNGAAAGQTIFHLHVHLIPRYKGDVVDPRGGVRGVIPDKKIY